MPKDGRRPGTPPDDDGRWFVPHTIADLVLELELCGVPLAAHPSEACRLLELQGSYASIWRVLTAQRRRRAAADRSARKVAA